jgi:hypothetical protein
MSSEVWRLASEETAEVIRAAATLVPTVVHLIDRCKTEPDPGSELARACGETVSKLCALQARLSDQTSNALVRQVDLLLGCQVRLLAEASALAFRPRGPAWDRVAARFGDSWGAASDAFIDLAAQMQHAARA